MINKKIILATCLGNIIGGSLFTLSDLYQKREQNILEFDITSAITVLSGCLLVLFLVLFQVFFVV